MSNHQFGLFGFVPPRKKIFADKEKIKLAKELYDKGDFKASARLIAEIRERLEQKYGV